jgi:superfamily II DNA or RNA helicase
VLTGTPIENRIDELFSIMGFLNPAVLGSLFRFNRDFYELDDRGRPCGYRNLDQLHARIKPLMLRRRKADVETELPERTDRNFLVPLSPEQAGSYQSHEGQVAKLVSTASRRPLTQQEQDKLMRELAMMRMICDTNFILDPEDRVCPKLSELEKLLEECRDNPGVKVLVFSEWERMLELVRGLCERLGLGYAYHSGSVPQKRRRAEILLFKQDPACRVFLTTDSGGTGLNLQNASVVINCDLPWNPARLEQRIARAWRKHQVRPVTVINLVSENTIEHRMLGTLASKQALADGVLDLKGSLDEIQFRGGRQQMIARLRQLVSSPPVQSAPRPEPKVLPVDRALAFSQRASEKLGSALLRCEEHYPQEGSHSVLVTVVERDAPIWQERLRAAYEELFGNGQTDPLAPVQFEVIDRATADALQRLVEAGLVARSTRAIRSLHPASEVIDPSTLTSEEQEKIRQHRQQAARKMKMARLLVGGGLAEEAREPLSAAILSLGRALASEQRLVEPEQASAALAPPLAHRWGTHLSVLRGFLCSDEKPVDGVLTAVETLLPSPALQS